ncbi:MAG TPA: protein kinase, partial [Vicinamibacterales bacterium]|nr:protein kinase [Vicinamibacterales bacterium]
MLTPPPVAPRDDDNDKTVFIDPQGASLDDDATRFESAPPGTRAAGNAEAESGRTNEPEDPYVTRFVNPDEATQFVDPDATRFVEPPAEDPDATRFVDPDVTRMASSPAPSDPDETRFVEAPRPPTVRPPTRPATRPPTGQRQGTSVGTRSGAKTTEGPTGPLEVGQAFSNRYHIIRVLGIGGMGAVYHAWDTELGMGVALKVIRPESSNDPAAAREMERRFKQELVLARQVTHKNVVRIHDLGEIDGIKYITMPYLEGSDLATVLKERGKMPVP